MADRGATRRRQGQDETTAREQADAAAAEAAAIGGRPQTFVADPAMRPVYEGGEGEAEGYEEAEAELVEHATHGDEQSAHAILHHQGLDEEGLGAEGGEADHEYSSELDEDLYGEDLDDEELDDDAGYE
jgi:hypothetical protein